MKDCSTSAPTPSSRPAGVALLVSNDADAVRQISESAARLAISIKACAQPSEAVRLLNHRKFQAVIVDLELEQQDATIMEQVRVSQSNRNAVTFVITESSQTTASSAFKMGSNFVLLRPLSVDSIDRTFRAAYGMIVRELRRSFRCPIAVPAVLQRPGREEIRCQTVDISEDGLGITTSLSLEPGAQVTIEFTLPGNVDPFCAAAQPRWCDTKGRVGLCFLNLSSSQKSELQGWLSSRLEKILPEQVVERFRAPSS